MVMWYVLFIFHPGLSIKIWAFEPSSNGEIAYKVIDKSTPLPKIFTLCSAFKEKFVYGSNSFFTLYGEQGEPWMSLTNWPYDHIELWTRINTVWLKIRDMPAYLMNSWIHICIMVDTVAGNLSVAINDEPPSAFTVPELSFNTPKNLKDKLYVGKVEDSEGIRQYQGEVANINIFSGLKHIENLLESSCKHSGDIVNKDTEWKKIGDVGERNDESWEICNKYEKYRVANPAKINWNKATDTCYKLGRGNITEPESERDITNIVSKVKKIKNSCKYVWTPYNT